LSLIFIWSKTSVKLFLRYKLRNIRTLEHHSNKNFYQYGIENIGENLQQELLEIKIDECRLNVRKDLFYIFQDKVVYIRNGKKCLMIKVGYHFYDSVLYQRISEHLNS
jgi:hypothetical protein